jgi:hypothetical protein
MSKELGHPEVVTIVAIDLKPRQGSTSSPGSRAAFARLLSVELAQACVLQSESRQGAEPASTAVVTGADQTLAILHRLTNLQAEFGLAFPGSALRFVAHHGLVFTAPGNQSKSYLGSGVRSAHSHLNRLPESLQRAVTEEFVSATQLWDDCPLHFEPLLDAEQAPATSSLPPGLMRFSLASECVAKPEPAMNDDLELKRYLTESLTTYLGPFAEILVDAAHRSGLSATSLVDEVSREISDLPARVRFRDEAMNFLAHQREAQPA